MEVIHFVKAGLIKAGYDGLFESGICACDNSNLSPNNCMTDSCSAGYKHSHSKTGEWIIHKNKNKISDEEINRILTA